MFPATHGSDGPTYATLLRRSVHADCEPSRHVRPLLRHTDERSSRPPAPEGTHLLVVIDHRLARVYKSQLHGAVPERLIPYDRSGFGRHLHHVEANGSGQRKPERRSFYEAVARTLRSADEILVFGSGTGASSGMGQLLAALRRNHPDLADRVVGSIVVDEHHLTEDQLLAAARAFYAHRITNESSTPC